MHRFMDTDNIFIYISNHSFHIYLKANTGDNMLNIQTAQSTNVYEAFYNKEITLEEFAMLIGVEPHLVILHLKELIKDYEEDYDFSPSLALYQMSKTLYDEFYCITAEDEKDRISMRLNIMDGIRKTAKTLDELRRVRQSTVVIQNNMAVNINVIENFLNKTTPYLCPKCQEMMLNKYDEILQSVGVLK